MVYTFSDNLGLNRINVVQRSVSGARVYLLAENEGERNWIDMGTLDKSLVTLVCNNELNLALKIEWDADSIPNITEIVRFHDDSCIHTNTEVLPGKAATCTEAGLTEGLKCADCNAILVAQEIIPALGHEYTPVVTAPTCTKSGYTTYTCVCGDSYVADYVPALGHNYVDGVCTGCGRNENGGGGNTGSGFVDVPANSYYVDAVLWAVNNGITTGVSPTRFNPNGACTRGQVVTFLWRAMGEPEHNVTENPFVDVTEADYYYDAVLWAYENGITTGVGDTHFNPAGECGREQVVTFLWRTMDEPASEAEIAFTDVAADAYYATAVAWAVENGITTGLDVTFFGVGAVCTRAQVVTFLYRTLA